MSKLNPLVFSMKNGIAMTLRLYTAQGCSLLKDLRWVRPVRPARIAMNMVTTITMLVICLQSTSILGKAFTETLLNTYFNVKTIPIVNELQDILDNERLSTTLADEWVASKIYPNLRKDQSEQIKKRVNSSKTYSSTYDGQLLRDLLASNIVILSDSEFRKHFFYKYRIYHDRFALADKKYFSNFASYNIRKGIFCRKFLVKL